MQVEKPPENRFQEELENNPKYIELLRIFYESKEKVLIKQFLIMERKQIHLAELKALNISLTALRKKARRAVCNLADYKYKQTEKGVANRKRYNAKQKEKRKNANNNSA